VGKQVLVARSALRFRGIMVTRAEV